MRFHSSVLEERRARFHKLDAGGAQSPLAVDLRLQQLCTVAGTLEPLSDELIGRIFEVLAKLELTAPRHVRRRVIESMQHVGAFALTCRRTCIVLRVHCKALCCEMIARSVFPSTPLHKLLQGDESHLFAAQLRAELRSTAQIKVLDHIGDALPLVLGGTTAAANCEATARASLLPSARLVFQGAAHDTTNRALATTPCGDHVFCVEYNRGHPRENFSTLLRYRVADGDVVFDDATRKQTECRFNLPEELALNWHRYLSPRDVACNSDGTQFAVILHDVQEGVGFPVFVWRPDDAADSLHHHKLVTPTEDRTGCRFAAAVAFCQSEECLVVAWSNVVIVDGSWVPRVAAVGHERYRFSTYNLDGEPLLEFETVPFSGILVDVQLNRADIFCVVVVRNQDSALAQGQKKIRLHYLESIAAFDMSASFDIGSLGCGGPNHRLLQSRGRSSWPLVGFAASPQGDTAVTLWWNHGATTVLCVYENTMTETQLTYGRVHAVDVTDVLPHAQHESCIVPDLDTECELQMAYQMQYSPCGRYVFAWRTSPHVPPGKARTTLCVDLAGLRCYRVPFGPVPLGMDTSELQMDWTARGIVLQTMGEVLACYG